MLNVQGNALERLDGSLEACPSLHTLDASNNDIDSIGQELAVLQRLHTLRLSYNHISSLRVFAEPDVAQGRERQEHFKAQQPPPPHPTHKP